jgi:hypothetical protein
MIIEIDTHKKNLLKKTIKKTFVFANFPVVEPLILYLEGKGRKKDVTQLWISSITKKKKKNLQR